jgi:AcrR family transcriptional regulator
VAVEGETGPKLRVRGHGGRPSRLESAQLSDRILDVATALFLGEGYGATSIEAIARRARISKRTFYHRFRGKEVLFETVLRRLIERWRSIAWRLPRRRGFPPWRASYTTSARRPGSSGLRGISKCASPAASSGRSIRGLPPSSSS